MEEQSCSELGLLTLTIIMLCQIIHGMVTFRRLGALIHQKKRYGEGYTLSG